MHKMNYERSVLDAILRTASAARGNGLTWKDTLVLAKKEGFRGASSTLQALVKTQSAGGANRNMERPAGNKNSVASVEEPAVEANAFVKAPVGSHSSETVSAPLTARGNETLHSIQNRLPVLRDGAQYARPISLFEGAFRNYGAGEIVAWSRILEKEEAVCVINSHETYPRGADILVDSELNPPGSFLRVIHASEAVSSGIGVGSQVPVQRRWDGTAFIAIRDLGPSASLVLMNFPQSALVRA